MPATLEGPVTAAIESAGSPAPLTLFTCLAVALAYAAGRRRLLNRRLMRGSAPVPIAGTAGASRADDPKPPPPK